MIYLGIAVVAILFYRVCFSLSGLLRTLYYEKKYQDYLRDPKADFYLYEPAVKKLFRQARVMDSRIPYSEPAGYGQIMTGTASMFDNMGSLLKTVVSGMISSFTKAKGYFRMSLIECASPLYWVQLVLFLPSKLCEYLGVSGDKIFPRILQVIYWIATPLLLLLRSDFYEYILTLLQQVK